MVADQTRRDLALRAREVTGPGGHRGNVSDSSVTGSQPHTGSSEKPLPGPVTTQRRTPALATS
ncbi:hypothetical protein GCM10009721_36420 [Terrabacter tumescens]|uniref:Uncharacterized protein n=1 Tax=Terrabacter tumescens TaxID=60443 RepID=A0ABQ2IAX7_9MICO|nr:hypothetical protein GCM10009721_36420 [Terrabacter tumescens]